MAPVKEKKIIKFRAEHIKKESLNMAKKLTLLAVAVILSLIISQWNEVVSFFPKLDNTVYKITQIDMGEHQIKSFGDKHVAFMGKTGLVVFDKKGREKFSVGMTVDSPAMDSAGNLIAFAPNGKNAVFVVDKRGKITDFKTENRINNLKISKSGKIVVLTDKKTYNGNATVYSKRGEALFEWNAGTCNLLDAALSPDGKKLAVSVVYTGGKKLECSIMMFETEKGGAPFAEKSTGDNFISSLSWTDNNTLVVVGDKMLCALNGRGADKWEFDYDGRQLTAFCAQDKNNIVIALGMSSLDKEYQVYSFTSNGRKQCEYIFEDDIQNISTNKNRILITSLNKAELINKSGRLRDRITSDKDMYGGILYKKGHKVMFDKGGFVEIVTMK